MARWLDVGRCELLEVSLSLLDEASDDVDHFAGCVQCMLKVVGPNGEANVFGGTGQTEEASKDCAARAAFVYLETFLDAAMKSQQQ